MKIVYSSDHPNSFSFVAVATGEIFKYISDAIYMKIQPIKDTYGNCLYNAIEINNGKPIKFKDNEQIILYNAELRLWR